MAKNEIAYYVLNALEVLQGKISTEEVLNAILADRTKGLEKKIETPNKAYSYDFQHINEQFDYLELANLIRKDGKNIWLNTREEKTVNLFVKDLEKTLMTDYSKYDFNKKGIGKLIEQEWREYFGSISKKEIETFTTTISSLETSETTDVLPDVPTISTIEIGDEGENFVLQIERARVKAFNPRLVNKVNFHGKQRGLGYDITSIEADRNKKKSRVFALYRSKGDKTCSSTRFYGHLRHDKFNKKRMGCRRATVKPFLHI